MHDPLSGANTMNDYPHVLVADGYGGQMAFPPFVPQANMDILAAEFVAQNNDVFVTTLSLIHI